MTASLSRTQSTYHARSNSLPSRPHPLSLEVGEYLSRLRSSEDTSTSSSSISRKISGLQDLNDCVNKLFQLPLTQQAFTQEQHKALVDQVLDGSLRLLDLCNSAKDALWQTKESVHEFQSAIRRKRGGEIGIVDEVRKFLASRKTVKKMIHKALKNLKGLETKYMFDKDDETFEFLKEVAKVNITVLESLFSFICGSKAQAKLTSNWSLLSKLMSNWRIACEEEDENEFGLVDSALGSFLGCKSDNNIKTENVQHKLQNLELCVNDLEGGVECIYRCLIKARVSILNIFNY
ncbi:uncharacterized protein LOC110819024 [Carica papaya]|uniref:uncharacterized protein LOC110819024 n=1 Tax=Carica papaya TaxID=3649 RepID=UPI000B8CD139|nr:uncharacterized protein LOC110819024 [Carica papaya]